MREQASFRKHQLAHRRKIFERRLEAQRSQKFFRFRKHPLGLVAKTEQSLFASRTAASFGYRKYFIWRHVRRHTGLRISAERAITAIVATQVGKWNENFSGITYRIAFEAVPDSTGRLD